MIQDLLYSRPKERFHWSPEVKGDQPCSEGAGTGGGNAGSGGGDGLFGFIGIWQEWRF